MALSLGKCTWVQRTRTVENLITRERNFIVSGYDQYLEQVQVLARFDKAWVECDLVVNQLIRCEQVGTPR